MPLNCFSKQHTKQSAGNEYQRLINDDSHAKPNEKADKNVQKNRTNTIKNFLGISKKDQGEGKKCFDNRNFHDENLIQL